MRFLIKLFDREPIKNVLSATVFKPEVVVYLCDETHVNLFQESALYRFFKQKKMQTKPRFFYLDPWNPTQVRKVLSAVMRDYAGGVLDLTGGQDLMLVMAGMLAQDLNLPAFHIDIYGGRFGNVRACEDLQKLFYMPVFSAEDLLAITGAGIQGYGHIQPTEWDEMFENRALQVFFLMMQNTGKFGRLVGYLQKSCAGTHAETLCIKAPKSVHSEGRRLRYDANMFAQIEKIGLLSKIREHDTEIEFCFKNALYRRCLLGVGVWLEMYAYITAKRCGFFDEVCSSVVINWNGKGNDLENTRNEVDLLLVKGIMPIFISCKTGIPHAQALYEIKQLCERFSGNFGRAALISAQDLGRQSDALKHRAAELRILLLDRRDIRENKVGEKLMELAQSAAPRVQPPRVSPSHDEWVF